MALRDRVQRDQRDEHEFRMRLHGIGTPSDGSDGLPPTDTPGNAAYQQMRADLARLHAQQGMKGRA